MEYKHISDCWNALYAAKTLQEVQDLFEEFPRWSGDWDWYPDEDHYVVVENSYYDKSTDTYDTDSETLDILVDDEYFDDDIERPWDYGKHFN